uniref:Uncharacterized protein n=2 Tax=Oryza sativa subsp. japonica TaxID=39947 RepID=Q8S697_ORYSJ|nr:hypothetical protein [Oryza sativa Japonica Group]ABF96857.1 hypothetical protein LOC_Os03g32660 [Oryza sativa Japonica Group]
MAVAQPEVDRDGGSRRPEVAKRRRPRVNSGGGVSDCGEVWLESAAAAERGGARGCGTSEVERGNGAVDGVRTAAAVPGKATAQCGVNGSGGAARLEFAGEWRHLGSARGARGRARRLGDLGKNGRGGPGDAFYRSGRWRSWPWRAATAGG